MVHTEKIENTDYFCLHDSTVSKIEFIGSDLVLTFSEGFWRVNEDRQRKNCKIIYKFYLAEDKELNLYIYKVTDKKRKEIKFNDFAAMINKYGGFRIYMEFRCAFTRQLILEGNIVDKIGYYSIFTEEIAEIIYECDDD